MVVIRLTRVGKKNSPAYRVVVAEKRRAVKRKFIEVIGHYNPIEKPKQVVIFRDRALFWLKAGAQPSDTVRNLMADLDIIDKKEKANIKYARDKKKKELKAEAEAKSETVAPITETAAEIVETKAEQSDEPKTKQTEEPEVKKETPAKAETDEKPEETAKEEQVEEKIEDKKEEAEEKEEIKEAKESNS